MKDSDDPRYDEEPVHSDLLGQLTEDEAEDLARRYLLGQLAEEEAMRIEKAFGDDSLFDLVEAIEAELLDALAQGTLPPTESDLVLARLAASPRGRERLALEQDLAAEAARQRTVVPFQPRPAAPMPPAAPARRWASRRWAAAARAAALLLAIGLSVYSLDQYVHPDPPVVASFDVAVMVHRGADATEQLEVPSEVDRIDIRVDLGPEPGDAFQAVVRAADDDKVWRSERLAARTLPARTREVTLEIPARLLPPGHYTLEVWQPGAAVTDRDSSEGLVGAQTFEVVRP